MSENSSSSINLLFHPQLASSSPFLSEDLLCFLSRPSSYVFIAFFITNFFVISPFIILILHSALKDWKQRRATISTSAMSHFDCFTYNIVIMEMFGILRCIPYCSGIYTDNVILIFVGGLFSSFIWYGETFVHVLMCVERYLAIVHPITYLGLRNDRGTRNRNVSIYCVWLFCFIRMGLFIIREVFIIIDFCFLFLSLLVIAFCSLSVLCVLIRPGPGKQGHQRADQSKTRAFYMITTILGVLTLRFCASLSWTILFVAGKEKDCLLMACIVWLNLPTSLLCPLLFLHRAEKFRCSKNNFH